jgi:hypothetical protein
MAKFFTAEKSFIDYITMMGFQFKETDTEKKYYVNKKGNQIKVDFNSKIITLIDRNGFTVDFSETFTNEQIDKFADREDN